MLRPRRTSAPEQQPPQMKNNIDQKDPIRRHTNVDEQRRDPSKSTKDRSAEDKPTHHSDGTRSTTGRGLGVENLIPSSRSCHRLVFLSRTQTLAKLKETTKNGALPPTLAEIHRAPMALGPPERRRTCGGGGGRQKP